jgi:hypothetical protein
VVPLRSGSIVLNKSPLESVIPFDGHWKNIFTKPLGGAKMNNSPKLSMRVCLTGLIVAFFPDVQEKNFLKGQTSQATGDVGL